MRGGAKMTRRSISCFLAFSCNVATILPAKRRSFSSTSWVMPAGDLPQTLAQAE
jgi:hypothetical protein